MPKPFEEFEGNGMHLHISLFKDDKNLFAQNSLKSGISKEGEIFYCWIIKACCRLHGNFKPMG
ncbi:MAG: hypothetical protein CM15mP29_1510 [Alphaproteobacteria bacterium]|nr:MAG: hypothetical protein CM15mP29_1510 [Alphaproteobacteria bacterium]